jgi:hypothetical protein
MALPDPRVILAAKIYAHRLEIGQTAARAFDYVSNNFGLTAAQVRQAVRQAQRAVRVGAVLDELPNAARVREALEGRRAPAQRVGVRVEITRHRLEGDKDEPWRTNTLYIEVDWDATKQDVIDRIADYLVSIESGSGPELYSEIEFKGPTLWPGQSVVSVGSL